MKLSRADFLLNITVFIAVVGIILLVRIPNFQDQSFSRSQADPRRSNDLMSTLPISDTLTQARYQQMLDSAKMIQRLQNAEAGNATVRNLGGIISTNKAIGCDSCELLTHTVRPIQLEHSYYYLDLPGWTLKTPIEYHKSYKLSMFYVKNGIGYLRRFKTDLPVKFRYDHRTGHVLIPVQREIWRTLNTTFLIAQIIGTIWLIYLGFIFIRFLFSLSKGHIFTRNNLTRLLIIAITMFILPLLKITGTYLLQFIFRDYFTKDLVLDTDVFKDLWQPLAVGVVTLLLYKAFSAGKQLTEEQELTI